MQKSDFIPAPDANFDSWQGNLITELAPLAASLGIAPAEVAGLTTLGSTWGTEFGNWTTEDAKARQQRAKKDAARDAAASAGQHAGNDANADTHSTVNQAIRHCVASAVLATRLGCACSECAGNARETYQDRYQHQLPRDSARARHNNAAGLTCGGCTGDPLQGPPSTSVEDIASCCHQALDNGNLDTGS